MSRPGAFSFEQADPAITSPIRSTAIPAKVETGFASGIASEQRDRAFPMNRLSTEMLELLAVVGWLEAEACQLTGLAPSPALFLQRNQDHPEMQNGRRNADGRLAMFFSREAGLSPAPARC
jgi:hypothetical protein